MNSVPYWEKRYSADPNLTSSWPDAGARFLELDFIMRNVPVDPGSILEVGCGPFTLAESAPLVAWVAGSRYVGIDGSETAIALARARSRELGSASFFVQDFEAHRELKPASFVLCRRLLCNLSREARRDLLWQFSEYPHGLMIEPTKEGLAQLNLARLDNHLPPIPEAEHNDYLDEDEVKFFKNRRLNFVTEKDGARQISGLHSVKVIHFMSPYYARTRAKEELGDIDQQWRYEQAMAARNEGPGLLGPVVGFTW